MNFPIFDPNMATDHELDTLKMIIRSSPHPQRLAENSLGSWFQPGQCVAAKRLRLSVAGLSAYLLSRMVRPEEADDLIRQARATREEAMNTLLPK